MYYQNWILLTARNSEMAYLSIQWKQFKRHWTGKCQRDSENKKKGYEMKLQ